MSGQREPGGLAETPDVAETPGAVQTLDGAETPGAAEAQPGAEASRTGSARQASRADRDATPMRGVWVAIVILGGAAIVFLLLALSSGALNV